MESRCQPLVGGAPRRFEPEVHRLDWALLAGLLLEAVLETPGLPRESQARRRRIKSQVQENLVSLLAGHVTLDRFRDLLNLWPQCFSFYYPLIAPVRRDPASRPGEGPAATGPPGEPPGAVSPLRPEALTAWLQAHRELLPQRPHSKVTGDKLQEFLARTRGSCFRILDFQQFLGLDRKTAWEYLQKLRQAGLLGHNQGRSSAVRYFLAPRFLRVRSQALRQAVAAALTAFPGTLAARVSETLISTGGETFWQNQWQEQLPAAQRQNVITRLLQASVLQVVSQEGSQRQLRLQDHWLSPSQ
jgi:hypothetical protein